MIFEQQNDTQKVTRDVYNLTVPKASKVDPYKEQITMWLEEVPYSAERIFEKIKEQMVCITTNWYNKKLNKYLTAKNQYKWREHAMEYKTRCKIKIQKIDERDTFLDEVRFPNFKETYENTYEVLSKIDHYAFDYCVLFAKHYSTKEEFEVLWKVAELILLGGLGRNFTNRPKKKVFTLSVVKSMKEIPPDKIRDNIKKEQRDKLKAVLKQLEGLGILEYKELILNLGDEKKQVSWKIEISDKYPEFLIKNGWYELYIAGVVKTNADNSGLRDYELTHGVQPLIMKNAITDVDVMLAFEGNSIYIETKTSNYYKDIDLVKDLEKFSDHVKIFRIPKENACFVCLDKTDTQLNQMRSKAKGRFEVHDNNTFPAWIRETILSLKKQ